LIDWPPYARTLDRKLPFARQLKASELSARDREGQGPLGWVAPPLSGTLLPETDIGG